MPRLPRLTRDSSKPPLKPSSRRALGAGGSTLATLLLVAMAAALPNPRTARAESAGREPFLLVSDVDDTIKLSHVRSVPAVLGRTFLKRESFAGMASLYARILAASRSRGSVHGSFVALTASSTKLEGKVRSFLVGHGFPAHTILLRNWLAGGGAKEFKLQELEKLSRKTKEKFLLIGDDTEHDPEVYAEFNRRHPDRVLGMYIRQITDREIPPGITRFHTALEIAAHETAAGRLTADQAVEIGLEVLASEDDRVVAPFKECKRIRWIPRKQLLDTGAIPSQLEWLMRDVDARILALCSRIVEDQED